MKLKKGLFNYIYFKKEEIVRFKSPTISTAVLAWSSHIVLIPNFQMIPGHI